MLCINYTDHFNDDDVVLYRLLQVDPKSLDPLPDAGQIWQRPDGDTANTSGGSGGGSGGQIQVSRGLKGMRLQVSRVAAAALAAAAAAGGPYDSSTSATCCRKACLSEVLAHPTTIH
jgi:hypothetical protein